MKNKEFKYNITVAEFIKLLKDLPQKNLISDYLGVKPIDQVELFQKTFGDEVNELGSVPTIAKRKLRIKLLFEEMKELAIDGYGLEAFFKSICIDHLDFSKESIDTEIFNPEEALDAVSDILVVTFGAACINGHNTIIDKAFDETMRSNMSKICNTLDEAQASVAKYHKEGIETEPVKTGENQWTIYNKNTRKILKSILFQKPDYNELLNQ